MKAVETDINESTINEQQIWQILQEVKDPEIPVLSIIDLGIVRDVQLAPLSKPHPASPPSPKEKGNGNGFYFGEGEGGEG